MVGEIVWAPFPFTNLAQSKIRPVLIIADVSEVGENDWIVCEITSSPIIQSRSILITQNDMESGRLRTGSRVRPDRLMTLDEYVFQGTIGHLTDAKLAEITAAVRGLF